MNKLAKFIGYLEHPSFSRGRVALFNLLIPLGKHPEGSTIAQPTLKKLIKERVN